MARVYPSYDERIVAAEKKIESVVKLIDDRKKLIAKTEMKLNDRKADLERAIALLDKAKQKKEHLITLRDRPTKQTKPRISPEERLEQRKAAIAKAREVRAANKAQMDTLLEAIKSSGKTIEEVMNELKG